MRAASVKCVVGVLGLASVTVLSGCQAGGPPYTGVRDPVGSENYPRVVVSGELAGFIAVDQPVVEQDGVMKVTVPVRLLSDAPYSSNVQYRFLFLNENGAPARGGDMNWRFVNLPPRNRVFLTGNSMDTDAADWRCEIRLAR